MTEQQTRRPWFDPEEMEWMKIALHNALHKEFGTDHDQAYPADEVHDLIDRVIRGTPEGESR